MLMSVDGRTHTEQQLFPGALAEAMELKVERRAMAMAMAMAMAS